MNLQICKTLQDNPNLQHCDGWNFSDAGAYRCEHKGTSKCPLMTPEQLRELHVDYLRGVGFGKRYCNPDAGDLLGRKDQVRLYGENSDEVRGLDICADGIRTYWQNIGNHIRSGEGFMLLGAVGNGKTFALALTALEAKEISADVRYIYAPELFRLLHTNDSDLRFYRSCDLLLLDDFGAEYHNQWNIAGFIALVEHRHANELATCITTNLGGEEFQSQRLEPFSRAIDRWRESSGDRQFSIGLQSLRGRDLSGNQTEHTHPQ